ncbi:MAG: sodium-independent anion transporter, partial [Rhizobiaceae bacterium]|nr:sodium-independent anion transporter [Rhizobiaceae bacterium]
GGPTGAFIVVVFGVIAEYGYDGLVLATFMAGVILLVAGYFRAGSLIAYVPEAVINGFTIGIAVIIAISQLKDFLGLTIDKVPADFLDKMPMLWEARDSINGSALLIAVGTAVLIIGFRRVAPKFPGLIFAVAIGSAIVVFATLPVDTIYSRFGELPNHLPWPSLPDFSFDRMVALLPSAIVIAFLAGIESLLSATVADRMIEGSHRPNAEITAQGFANVASSLFGGMPVTGAIARTATNIRAGGKTPVAGIVHALVILIVMMVAAPIAGYLAMPALAALLIIVAWNMSEPHKWRAYMCEPVSDRVLLVITLVLTVVVDLTIAIGVGVAIGLALRLRQRKLPPGGMNPREE